MVRFPRFMAFKARVERSKPGELVHFCRRPLRNFSQEFESGRHTIAVEETVYGPCRLSHLVGSAYNNPRSAVYVVL